MRIGNKTMEPNKTDPRQSDGVHVSQQAMPKGFQKRTDPKTVRKNNGSRHPPGCHITQLTLFIL